MKLVKRILAAPFEAVAALVAMIVFALGWKRDGEK